MQELKEKAEWGLENLKKCFVEPDQIVGDKLKDSLKFKFSLSYVNKAIIKGILTPEEVVKRIKDGQTPSSENKTEQEECLQ